MASSTSERPTTPSIPPARHSGRSNPGLSNPQLLAVGLLTAVVALLAVDARATSGARVTADEPYYLLSALSLAEDRDLNIADELADQRFLPFHEIPLDPQTIELDGDGDGHGQRLSPHDPLLPVLLAPGMAIGGWVGAKTALALIAGMAAAMTAWVASHRLGVSDRAAAIAVVGLFTTPPLTTYATQVYPEMPAALAVVVALAGLLGGFPPGRSGTSRAAVVVAAIVALPWLSVKYVPVAAVLGIALLAANLSALQRRRATAITIGLVIAGAVYLVVHRRVYGGWTVYAAGDHFVDGEFGVIGTAPDYLGRSRRLIGLLIDQRFGLIPWAPAFLLLPAAVGLVGARKDWPRALLLATLGAGWGVATWVALTMHGWWWPGRQIVVILPVAALIIAGLIDRRPRLQAATVVASAAAAANWLWLAAEASTGRRTLVVDFFDTGAPLYRLANPVFPDHVVNSGRDVALTAVWMIALGLGGLLGWRAGRTGLPDSPTTPQPAAPPTRPLIESPSGEPRRAERYR